MNDDRSVECRRAVEAPADACVAIVGAPGTGKTATLRARAQRLSEAGSLAGILWLSDRSDFARLALEYAGNDITIVDDVEAERAFARACEPLFAMDWNAFSAEQLDPEIPGLRSPARFLNSAFRLIRRLRERDVDPDEFVRGALSGATDFYGRPPNLVNPRLLSALKRDYHDSLAVDADELQRQYRREVDLVKILGELYRRYVDSTHSSGRMTGRDVVAAAIARLRSQDARPHAALRAAMVDDVDAATPAEIALLRALFGNELSGVTMAGRSVPVIANARRAELLEPFRSPPALVAAQRIALGKSSSPIDGDELEVLRAKTVRDEAVAIARRVREWLDDGVSPQRIAVLFRSVRHVERYEEALLDRDVPVATIGDVNVFADRRALDAIALLWNAYDPFRHEWLLRTLSNPALGLSDASLAILCGEPSDPQTPLFALDGEAAPTERASRWDPKRDLRLGWNVVRGDRDGDLPADALARVRRFRKLRHDWATAIGRDGIVPFARAVWAAGLAREGRPNSARSASQQLVLQRLLDRLAAFERSSSGATLFDILEYARLRASSDLETCEDSGADGCASLASIDAVRGREFDRVVVAGVRPGSFPLWYAPDTFLMSPRLGIVPRENVGDARTSRTAKFSYYVTATKAAEKYYHREREALAYAIGRARERVLVTASGTPTRGVSAPELLEELRSARPQGPRALEAS